MYSEPSVEFLLPHPSTDRNETRTWFSLSPRNILTKCGTNPPTIFLVIVITDKQTHTHTQTDTQTTTVKTYSLAFAGRKKNRNQVVILDGQCDKLLTDHATS